jgi:hypothetical protein
MKTSVSDKLGPKAKVKVQPSPARGLEFVEVGGGGGPAPDARARLARFYAKNPLRALRRGERGIVEGLKADRDRR